MPHCDRHRPGLADSNKSHEEILWVRCFTACVQGMLASNAFYDDAAMCSRENYEAEELIGRAV